MTGAITATKDDPKARLRDPAYFALHLQAVAAIRDAERMNWYDSHFLRRLEIAKTYLARVRPDALPAFLAGFEPLKPPPAFREIGMEDVFDSETHASIVAASRVAEIERFEKQDRENADFGREVVWNHPLFLELQERVRPRIEALVGTPLLSSYNFLSRYGPRGKCDVHMDHPNAMYTFDYCIEQDAIWPIYVSRVVDWPTGGRDFDPARVIADPDLDFREHRLVPNRALLFNGSSQWHFRHPKSAGGFCHLLFFHYYPKGCETLVDPARWAEHSGIAELQALCDLFRHSSRDGFD